MYYRINMQTLFLKIFVCELVESHLSAILTNFFQCRRRFQYSGRAFLRFLGRGLLQYADASDFGAFCLFSRKQHIQKTLAFLFLDGADIRKASRTITSKHLCGILIH